MLAEVEFWLAAEPAKKPIRNEWRNIVNRAIIQLFIPAAVTYELRRRFRRGGERFS